MGRHAAVVAAALAVVLCACVEQEPLDVDAPVPAVPVRMKVGDAPAPLRAPRAHHARKSTGRGLIGLVASDDDAITAALAAGARRALDESRAAGGPDLELRVAPHEARWGAAAEAAVRLALDEGAVAIITPPERTRAHAIAQLGTRAGVPIVSTSPAPTVMQAGSTWVTSVVEPCDGDGSTLPERDWERAGHDAARRIVDARRIR